MHIDIFLHLGVNPLRLFAGELGRPRDGWRPGSDAVLHGRRDPWMATWWARHGLAWPGYRSGGNVATGWWLGGVWNMTGLWDDDHDMVDDG